MSRDENLNEKLREVEREVAEGNACKQREQAEKSREEREKREQKTRIWEQEKDRKTEEIRACNPVLSDEHERHWVERVFAIFAHAIRTPRGFLRCDAPMGETGKLFFRVRAFPCYLCPDELSCEGLPRGPRCLADYRRFVELCNQAGFAAHTTKYEQGPWGRSHDCPESISISR